MRDPKSEEQQFLRQDCHVDSARWFDGLTIGHFPACCRLTASVLHLRERICRNFLRLTMQPSYFRNFAETRRGPTSRADRRHQHRHFPEAKMERFISFLNVRAVSHALISQQNFGDSCSLSCKNDDQRSQG